uniref:Uncharacterized protein n=1 Tax=Glossina austeni TaxID=7395 RepID=A0A1A9UJP0_GLOAU
MKDTGSGAKNSTSSIEPGNRNISLRCITYSCRVWVCVVFGVSSTTTKFTGRLTRGEISEVVITTPSSNTVNFDQFVHTEEDGLYLPHAFQISSTEHLNFIYTTKLIPLVTI